MKVSELVYIGIKGSVLALERSTGQQVWATHLKGYDFVNVLVEEGGIIATTYGEVFCLNPFTGEAIWHNPLKGHGRGLATVATENGPGSGFTAVAAEKRRRDQQAAASGAAVIT